MTGLAAGPEREEHFRPDLEGLRAVAVGLVMAFHAGIGVLAGGYVGVDVFYVLSGFLITGLLLREFARSGTISLSTFYARRARRLLPAAAFVLLAIVVVSAALLSPLRLRDLTADAVAAALYVVNIRFAAQATDYLAADVAPSPLLHYWSLAVEEQFYFVWPLLVLGVARARGRAGSLMGSVGGRVGIAVGVVAVASFVTSLVLTRVAEPWAFFSLPARAWELGIGAALAVLAARGVHLPRAAAAGAVVAGVALIVTAALRYDVTTAFPGVAAVLPAAGAALVIAGGIGGVQTLPSRLLAVRPMRFIGRISYSLYLWHWPVIVIPTAVAGSTLELRYRLALMALAIPLAWATTRWVEDPIRRGSLARWPTRRALGLAATVTAVVALAAGTLPWWAPIARPSLAMSGGATATPSLAPGAIPPDLASVLGTPRAARTPRATAGATRSGTGAHGATPSPTETSADDAPSVATVGGPVPADLRPPILAARDDQPVIYGNGCVVAYAETRSRDCIYGDPAGTTTVMLIGDSHAAQWFGPLERLARERGWRLVVHTKSACAFIDHLVWIGRFKRAYTECTAWRDDVVRRVVEERPGMVVVSSSRFVVLDVDGQGLEAEDEPELFDAALARTLRQLGAAAGDVTLIGDTPTSDHDVPECLANAPGEILACATPWRTASAIVRHTHDRVVADAAGVTFIDPDRWLCPSEPCPPVIGSTLVYRDKGHMTHTFAVGVAPYLAAELPPFE